MRQMRMDDSSSCSSATITTTTNVNGSGNSSPPLLPVPNATTPYWRTRPHPIDEYRSSATLPQECDIVIIGAGLSGVSVAYHLTKDLDKNDLPRIVMLEARQGHVKCQVATILSGIKEYGLEAVQEFVDLIRSQPYALKEVIEAEGIDCEFELRRSFDVFLDRRQAEETRTAFAARAAKGDKWIRDSSVVPPEFAEEITSIHSAHGAFTVPIASFWPYKFVSQLLARLVLDRQLLDLHTNTPVTSISTTAHHNLIRTPRGTIRAPTLILATNGYTAGLLPAYTHTITPCLGTASHISPATRVAPHLNHTYNITFAPGRTDYLNPRPDGSIVVGGAQWTYNADRSRFWNVWDDSRTLPEAQAQHFDGLMQRSFRGWQDSGARVDHLWTGVMGYTPDGMPHVGPVPGVPRGRQWVLAGFNGGGNGLCFGTAEGLVRMIREGTEFGETGLPRLFETTRERLERE